MLQPMLQSFRLSVKIHLLMTSIELFIVADAAEEPEATERRQQL